jgi:hypothetical protein
VAGAGDTDNASFQVVGDELQTAAVFDFESKSSYSIRLRVTDSGTPAASYEEPFTITILDVNDPPVAGADSYSGVIGNTLATRGVTVTGQPVVVLTGNLLTDNDTDQDGDPLTAVAATVSSTGGGTATIAADGSFTFLPEPGDKNQTDTFTYQVRGTLPTPAGWRWRIASSCSGSRPG